MYAKKKYLYVKARLRLSGQGLGSMGLESDSHQLPMSGMKPLWFDCWLGGGDSAAGSYCYVRHFLKEVWMKQSQRPRSLKTLLLLLCLRLRLAITWLCLSWGELFRSLQAHLQVPNDQWFLSDFEAVLTFIQLLIYLSLLSEVGLPGKLLVDAVEE